MKRKILICLAVVLVLMLSACGSTLAEESRAETKQETEADSEDESAETGGQQEAQDKISAVEHCVALIHLTINPEIELYLDEVGDILAAKALNDDGNKILENVQLSGVYCVDALEMILRVGHAHGFVRDGAEIKIGTYMTESSSSDCSSYIGDMTRVVNFFGEEKEIALSLKMNQSTIVVLGKEPSADVGENGSDLTENGSEPVESKPTTEEDRFTQVERDGNGNIIRGVYVDGVGNRHAIEFRTDGTMMKEVIDYVDGRNEEVLFNEKEQPIQVIVHLTDGQREMRNYTYHANGKLSHLIIREKDGTEIESIYDENGDLETEVVTRTDGSVTQTTYGTDGKPVKSTDIRADGVRVETAFDHATGSQTLVIAWPNGTVTNEVRTFHPNGNLATVTTIWENGSWEKTVYNESDQKVRTDCSDGRYRIYRENGKDIEYKSIDNFGRWVHVLVNADSTMTETIWEFDGTYYVNTYDANRNLLDQKWYNANGNLLAPPQP